MISNPTCPLGSTVATLPICVPTQTICIFAFYLFMSCLLIPALSLLAPSCSRKQSKQGDSLYGPLRGLRLTSSRSRKHIKKEDGLYSPFRGLRLTEKKPRALARRRQSPDQAACRTACLPSMTPPDLSTESARLAFSPSADLLLDLPIPSGLPSASALAVATHGGSPDSDSVPLDSPVPPKAPADEILVRIAAVPPSTMRPLLRLLRAH